MKSDDFYLTREWRSLRYRCILASDGCCSCCKQRGTRDNPIQVDHIKPRSRFPELALDITNLQVMCKQCNLGKGAWDQTDWRPVPPAEMTEIFARLEIERKARRELIDRWVSGSTALERQSARDILKAIDEARARGQLI